jgi:Cof subfamily protein (haloacid dehalogenase superfamily)
LEYKLLALDIDGTLLSSKHKIPKNVNKALNEAREKGAVVTLATGRFYGSALRVAKNAGVNAPIVANDGAQIQNVYTGDLIYFKPVELEIAQEIIRIIRCYPVELQVFTKDLRIYAGKGFRFKKLKNALMRRYLSIGGCYNYIRDFVFAPVVSAGSVENILNKMKEPPAKLVVNGEADIMTEFRYELDKQFSGLISMTTAIENYIDILAYGVSKAHGLEILSEYLGISRKNIIAAGDNYNDIEMLEYAGLGVAMGNAPDIVKDKADIIADSNDNDGLVKIINRYLI